MFVCIYVHLHAIIVFCLFVRLSVSVYLSICLSLRLSILAHLSIYVYVRLHVHVCPRFWFFLVAKTRPFRPALALALMMLSRARCTDFCGAPG